MDWVENGATYNLNQPVFVLVKGARTSIIEPSELSEKYGIKVLGWKYTRPIKQNVD